MEIVRRPEPFQRDNIASGNIAYRHDARPDRGAVDVDSAGAAAGKTTAKSHGVEAQLVAEDVEKGGVESRLNPVRAAIDRDLEVDIARAGHRPAAPLCRINPAVSRMASYQNRES
jgi:hypothetical protein